MTTSLRTLCSVIVTFIAYNSAVSRANTMTIMTSADPIHGWRTLAPVGDRERLPMDEVGREWEMSNHGWNSSISFDDSTAAGWDVPVRRDVSAYGGKSTNNIWANTPDQGNTPAYFRKVFLLDSLPTFGYLGSDTPTDYRNVVDDDAQIYVNGHLVVDDTNSGATFIPATEITQFLRLGPNLLAIKAHDSFGGDEHFSLSLSITILPEPASGQVLLSGLLLLRRQRF